MSRVLTKWIERPWIILFFKRGKRHEFYEIHKNQIGHKTTKSLKIFNQNRVFKNLYFVLILKQMIL